MFLGACRSCSARISFEPQFCWFDAPALTSHSERMVFLPSRWLTSMPGSPGEDLQDPAECRDQSPPRGLLFLFCLGQSSTFVLGGILGLRNLKEVPCWGRIVFLCFWDGRWDPSNMDGRGAGMSREARKSSKMKKASMFVRFFLSWWL